MTDSTIGPGRGAVLHSRAKADAISRQHQRIGSRMARTRFRDVVNSARLDHERIVITDHGAPACAVVPISDLQMLDLITPEKHRKYSILGENVRVLYDRREIAVRVSELAAQIANSGVSDLVILSVLHGGFMFASDMVRALYSVGMTVDIGFVTISSYGDDTISKGPRIEGGSNIDLANKDVLIVDDVMETGRTLAVAREMVASRNANHIATVVMADKPGHRDPSVKLQPDFVGFECDPNDWLVGYGMDHKKRLRELPFIGSVS